MSTIVVQADTRRLPLPDESVDLIVTSPPYFALRSYTDDGEHYAGQIGSEDTPQEFIAALVECTHEWVRVLKPSGSLFVDLGDCYSKGGERIDGEFTSADAAWLAGVIDSDGSISVKVNRAQGHSPSFVPWCRVGQMDREVVDRIAALTGIGKVYQDKRGCYHWNSASQQTAWVLDRIWPWLRIKQRQACAAIELARHVRDRKRKGSWAPLTEDDIAYRDTIAKAVIGWNRGERVDWEPPIPAVVALPDNPRFMHAKSLMLLPERYRIACVDDLGLIARAVITWSKPNGLPESVTDRVRRSHEDWVHLTKRPRYYSAVDEIRTEHKREWHLNNGGRRHRDAAAAVGREQSLPDALPNPLGALPGSVWTIPTEPLKLPAHLGVDHFAAFPSEWPRRLILGWSPPGICVECGEGRRPVVDRLEESRVSGNQRNGRRDATPDATWSFTDRTTTSATITGYACDCPTPDAPTRPSVILDPFGGTGTTAAVASALGRTSISVDLSHDYSRVAVWRSQDSALAGKVQGRMWKDRQTTMDVGGAA